MEPKKDVVEKGRSVAGHAPPAAHVAVAGAGARQRAQEGGRGPGGGPQDSGRQPRRGCAVAAHPGGAGEGPPVGVGSAAAEQRDRNDRLADRLEDLEGGFEELGKEMRANNKASEDRDRAIREEMAQGFRQREREQAERRTAEDAGGEAKANGAGPQPRKRSWLRREYPDLVTLEPAEDDEDVFGGVWPLIVEWRELKAVHPDAERACPGCAPRSGSWRWS